MGKERWTEVENGVLSRRFLMPRVSLYPDGVVRRRKIRDSREAREYLIPIETNDLTIVTRVLDYRAEDCEWRLSGRTLALVGGGCSEARGSSWMVEKLRLAGVEDRILVLSHVGGLVVSERKREEREFGWEMGAEILNKTLESKSLRVDLDALVGVGYSSGGAQLTAMGLDRLVLSEPAGMGEHPKLAYGFVIGNLLKIAYRHYEKLGFNAGEVRKAFCDEVGASWVTSEGMVGSIRALVKEVVTGQKTKKGVVEVAKLFGLENDLVNLKFPIALFGKDSTVDFRQRVEGPVLVSLVLGSRVVNLLVSNEGKYRSSRQIMKEWRENPDEVRKDGLEVVEKLFPGAKKTGFFAYPDWTHTVPLVDQEYWNGLVSGMMELPFT